MKHDDTYNTRNYFLEALAIQKTDLDAAITIATEGIQANTEGHLGYGPEKLRLYSIRSTFYEFLKNYEAAIEDMSKVISICLKYPEEESDIGEYYAYRGYLFRLKGDFHAAVDDYTAAIATSPGSYRHYLDRGLNKLSLADKDSAIDDFKQALNLVEKGTLDFQWLEDFLAKQDKTE
jgi:tetratricopeptide (TPR) repeat protein